MRATVSSSDYQFIVDFTIYPIQIHWPTIISDICHSGMTPYRQAQSIDCEWSTFQRWQSGSQPLFKNGHALLILHSKICGITLTQKRLEEFVSTHTI